MTHKQTDSNEGSQAASVEFFSPDRSELPKVSMASKRLMQGSGGHLISTSLCARRKCPSRFQIVQWGGAFLMLILDLLQAATIREALGSDFEVLQHKGDVG